MLKYSLKIVIPKFVIRDFYIKLVLNFLSNHKDQKIILKFLLDK